MPLPIPPPPIPPRVMPPPPRKPPPPPPPPPRRCATPAPAARLQHKAIRKTSFMGTVPLLGSLPPRRRRRKRAIEDGGKNWQADGLPREFLYCSVSFRFHVRWVGQTFAQCHLGFLPAWGLPHRVREKSMGRSAKNVEKLETGREVCPTGVISRG